MKQKNQNSEPNQRVVRVRDTSLRMKMYSTVRKILIGFILISIANGIYSEMFYTPKVHNINKKNRELIIKYNLLNNRIAAAENWLAEISHRDNHVYRSLFGVDSINIEEARYPYPDSKYEELQNDNFSPITTESWKKIDNFAKKLYTSSISLDELQTLAQNKESMTAALPAIWPIDKTKQTSFGPFGMRNHPVYGGYRMHKGVDLGAARGTAIFATGDGVVEKSIQGLARSGYGQEILINHEFGYKTRYAHMSKRYVQKGDSVKRGQIIGEVGSTGVSTSPHLHYEVIYKGSVVNPINYFDRNMSNEEYLELTDESKSKIYE